MRIGELAKRSGLSASRIRFYEEEGLLPKAHRGGNGYRDYPESALERLRLIRDSQTRGFSLSEIKFGLEQARGAAMPSRDDILEALRCKLGDLDAQAAVVNTRRHRIIELIDEFKGC